MKVIDQLIKYNTLSNLVQKGLGLFVPVVFWLALPLSWFDSLAALFFAYYFAKLVSFGMQKTFKVSFHREASEGNHKYEFYLFLTSVGVTVLLALLSLFTVPGFLMQFGTARNHAWLIELSVLFILLKTPLKTYLASKRVEQTVLFAQLPRMLLSIVLITGSIIVGSLDTYLSFVSWTFFMLSFLSLSLFIYLGYENTVEQKFKIEYEDSGKYKEVHKLVFVFLKECLVLFLLLGSGYWMLSAVISQTAVESGFYLLVLFPLELVMIELITLFPRTKLTHISDVYRSKNYSGLDKLIQFTNLFLLLVGVPFTVYLFVFAEQLQTVFGLTTLSASTGGLMILLLPLLFLNTWFVRIIEKSIYLIVAYLIGVGIHSLFVEYLILLYGTSGFLMSVAAVLLFIWILLLFVLNQFVGFEWMYFLRKVGIIITFAGLETGILIGVRILLDNVMHFTTGNLQEWMMLGISMIIVIVLDYALMITSGMVRLFVEEPIRKEEMITALEKQALEEIVW